MDIDALTFDGFGAAVEWRGSIVHEGEVLAAECGLDGNASVLAWRARCQPAKERIRSGEFDFVKLDVLQRRHPDEVVAEFAVDGLGEADRVDPDLAWQRLAPWPACSSPTP